MTSHGRKKKVNIRELARRMVSTRVVGRCVEECWGGWTGKILEDYAILFCKPKGSLGGSMGRASGGRWEERLKVRTQ